MIFGGVILKVQLGSTLGPKANKHTSTSTMPPKQEGTTFPRQSRPAVFNLQKKGDHSPGGGYTGCDEDESAVQVAKSA